MLPACAAVLLLTGSVASWTISQWPQFLNVSKKSEIILQCSFEERSPPPTTATIWWTWNTVVVYEFINVDFKESNVTDLKDPRITIETNLTGKSHLTIKEAVEEDSALYVCAVDVHGPLPISNRQGRGTLVFVSEDTDNDTAPSPCLNISSVFTAPVYPTMYASNNPKCAPSVPLCVILFLLFVVIVLFMCGGTWILNRKHRYTD
ncbi:uncharacterized protein [Hyperolius riggenbachi]|uniref:uncharacterized protein n=1 Tax=Hyperolius riggenbachi TaxID=752182 RepID=UPI0035A3BEC3